MAPNFRTNTQTRRGNRAGYVEHDDFEGLPVRQWRQEWVSVAPPPPAETTQKSDIWDVELPHGMPKDSQLLPQHTQELLRAARSGRLYKRPAPVEEEDADADAAPDKADKKDDDQSTKGFLIRAWKQIPRNSEGSTVSHLAKRRKNTVTLSSSLPAGLTSGPTVTKATVRRVDAAGNPYTQEVTLAEGQSVDGEIISTTVVPAPPANVNPDGTAAPIPVKRRPPPPKRKPKGPGRGRKKKLPLPASTRPEPSGAPGAVPTDGPKPENAGADAIKKEGANDQHNEHKTQDTEMGEADDDDEGSDDGEEGEEGGDDEEGDAPDTANGTPAAHDKESSADQDMKNSPSVEPPVITAPPIDPDAMEISAPEESQSTTSVPSLPHPSHLMASRLEGSPLKNVLSVPSPTEAAPAQPSRVSPPEVVSTTSEPAVAPPTETKSDPIPAPVESVEQPLEQPIIPSEQPVVPSEQPDVQQDASTEPQPSADVHMMDVTMTTTDAAPEPDVTAEATAEAVTEAVSETVADTLPELAPEAPPEPTPEAVPEPAPEAALEAASEVMPEGVSDTVLEAVAEAIPEAAPEVMPEATSEVAPAAVASPGMEGIEMDSTAEIPRVAGSDVTTPNERSAAPAPEQEPAEAQEASKQQSPREASQAPGNPQLDIEPLPSVPEPSIPAEPVSAATPEQPQPDAEVQQQVSDHIVPIPEGQAKEPASSLPPLNPAQTSDLSVDPPATAPETGNEPASPDLLGGLEAVLDRHHSGSKEGPSNDRPSAEVAAEPESTVPSELAPTSQPEPALPVEAPVEVPVEAVVEAPVEAAAEAAVEAAVEAPTPSIVEVVSEAPAALPEGETGVPQVEEKPAEQHPETTT
ncbi:uncharacterized protein PG986_010850 [Apiospora aurea]|uniref:Apopolysialoglycoprotein n=1 Tax=Apiospora aurea TaxID=335848 RepID=A0ABR1Q3F4_9PEZI